MVDFENDLIPVFTKAGCNANAYHGAAIGRGGFQLSPYDGDSAYKLGLELTHVELVALEECRSHAVPLDNYIHHWEQHSYEEN